MMRNALLILFIILGTFAATVSAQDKYCHKADFAYQNQTGTDQTVYATVYDESDNEIIGDSEEIGTVGPGGTIEEEIAITAPGDDDGVIVVYSTGELDPNNPQIIGASTLDPCFVFNDGRLNWTDAAAPAIVYAKGGGVQVYVLEGGQGVLSVDIPRATVLETVATATSANENTLIEENGHIAVYALSSGTCQMNAFGALYVFEWRCV